jgi:hypothetical protein
MQTIGFENDEQAGESERIVAANFTIPPPEIRLRTI